jgi:hypothetical protein
MRAIVDLVTNRIIKVGPTPLVNEETVINGNYIFPVPEGAAVKIEEGDYILPQDTGSIPYHSAQELLVRYPMYEFIHYNFLLQAADIGALDLTPGAPMPPVALVQGPRCKVGRAVGPAPIGNAPTSVSILAANSSATPVNKAGYLVTDTIDISTITTGAAGTDEVMIWFEVGTVVGQEDVARGYGASTSALGNQPADRRFVQSVPTPIGLQVWASNDDGVSWYQSSYLEPTDLVDLGSNLRICFINTSSVEFVLLGFCVLFVDTWVSG